MTHILYLKTSPRGDVSYSNRVAAQVLDELRKAHRGASVTVRDLASEAVDHIDSEFTAGLALPPEKLSPEQRAKISRSDALADELLAADIVLIAVGMSNFTIPSTLKAWIDHVARSGKTFRYDKNGQPHGLATGKQVILVQAKGGIYSEGPGQSFDFVTPYLKHMLGFMGMTDVKVIDIEGTVLGEETATKALMRGGECARHVVAEFEAA